MAMKKNISKALAMAVMMSLWCGSAYADTLKKANEYTDQEIAKIYGCGRRF